MTGLVLKLAPNERILINGAVLENGNRRGRLNILTPDANILRLRDAIHPAQADTPVRRLCYTAQLVLSGDKDMRDVESDLIEGVDALSRALSDPARHESLAQARRAVEAGQPYYILKHLRRLLDVEEKLLGASGP